VAETNGALELVMYLSDPVRTRQGLAQEIGEGRRLFGPSAELRGKVP
jgi:hypothetical protein